MKTIAGSILIASLVAMAPTATRPTPTTIIVEGADYATVDPNDPIGVAIGIPIVDSLVWNNGTIEYIVDPIMDYTVTAYGPMPSPIPDGFAGTAVEIPLPVTVEHKIDWIIYNRIVWERALIELTETEGLDFFDIRDSTARVQAMLERE